MMKSVSIRLKDDFIKKAKKSAFGIAKGMRSFTKEDEFDTHA